MHKLATTFVLGYHGCDKTVADQLLAGKKFKPSRNRFDWLGHGAYFWEANPSRGLEYAKELMGRPKSKIRTPAVVGAVIDLGRCLDLSTSSGIAAVKKAYPAFVKSYKPTGEKLPKNKLGPDLLLRFLDCAVIQYLHYSSEEEGEPPFDTVKGIFVEGDRIYDGSGFHDKTHTQICVRDISCIKGVFRVPRDHLDA